MVKEERRGGRGEVGVTIPLCLVGWGRGGPGGGLSLWGEGKE